MPFEKGQSGNPGGRPKKSWIKDRERMREVKATWQRLLRLRDDMILERREVKDDAGNLIVVEVVPSAKDLIKCCEVILDRAIGRPTQQIEGGLDMKHSGTVGTNRESLKYFSTNPKAMELARQLAELMATQNGKHGNGTSG